MQYSAGCIILAPPFECDFQITFWGKFSGCIKNDTLRKVEFEGETLSTPIHCALTSEHHGMDRDVLPQPVQVTRECQFSLYETFSDITHWWHLSMNNVSVVPVLHLDLADYARFTSFVP